MAGSPHLDRHPCQRVGAEVQSNPSRAEGVVQVTILLTIGLMAGAASWTHIHDLAIAHGQPSWIGWSDAVVTELLPVAAGLEMRRRKRLEKPVTFPLCVLVAAAGLSTSAQVAAAEQSLWGWLMAALPALGFLACVKIVVSRAPTTNPATNPQPDSAIFTVEPEPLEGLETPLELTETRETSPEVHPYTPKRPKRSESKSASSKKGRRPLEESARIYREALADNPQATADDLMRILGITTTRQLYNIRRAATPLKAAV